MSLSAAQRAILPTILAALEAQRANLAEDNLLHWQVIMPLSCRLENGKITRYVCSTAHDPAAYTEYQLGADGRWHSGPLAPGADYLLYE